MKITTELDFLIEEYGMKYQFQSFEKTVGGGFWGPCEAYSYYNDYGCFTIYNIVQRGDLDFYYSPKFSCNQNELLQDEVNLNLGCEEIWLNMPHKIFGQRKIFYKTLAKAIKFQIHKYGAFYGIKVENHIE